MGEVMSADRRFTDPCLGMGEGAWLGAAASCETLLTDLPMLELELVAVWKNWEQIVKKYMLQIAVTAGAPPLFD